MKKRYEEIDIMRGLAIIAMIGIHTSAYYQQIPVYYALWDTLEFAVPIFIFCSAYLYFKQESHHHIRHTLGYFKKRLVRMLLPYYTFLLIYLPLVYFTEPKKVTQSYVTDNIFLTGGIDFNWMVLLILLLSFLMPVLMFLHVRRRWLYYAYIAFAGAVSILFLFWRPYDHYRVLMIVPWSLLIAFSWYIADNEHASMTMLKLYAASIATFFVTRFILSSRNLPLDHFQNKYPPNLFHLSYGFISIIGLFYLSHVVKNSHGLVRRIISFFSKHSYTIYFIHIYIIYYITVTQKTDIQKLGFPAFFAEVLLFTAGIQLVFKFAHSLSKRAKPANDTA